MANQIERDVYVTHEPLKNPISYVRGTDAIPIVFHFRDYDIPSGASVSVFVAKPSGKAVYNSATISGNDVTVTVDSQMFMELGTSEMQVSISQGGKELVQFAQPVNVKANLKAGDFPDSSTSSSFLDDMIAQAQEAVNNANIAAQQAQTAVQNANLAVSNANDAVDSVNAMISSMGVNFSSLAQSTNIAQLQTTNKNLVGAINELNSKSLHAQSFIVRNDTDWDTVVAPGVYKVQVGSWTEGKNSPYNGGITIYEFGLLIVCATINDDENRSVQIYIPDTTSNSASMRIAYRMHNVNYKEWLYVQFTKPQ